MPTDPRLLILTQWLSPAYPIGAFAFSHGLEAACHDGQIRDAAGLQAWLTALLTEGSGWTDAVWIATAARGTRPVSELEALARAYAASAERCREADRQGAAFARVTQDVWDLSLQTRYLPVALGEASGLLDLPIEEVICLYLQSFVGNLVAASQRLMPLGQTDAQRIVARLAPLYLEIAARACEADERAVFSNAFASDIAAMRHETMETRVFQT